MNEKFKKCICIHSSSFSCAICDTRQLFSHLVCFICLFTDRTKLGYICLHHNRCRVAACRVLVNAPVHVCYKFTFLYPRHQTTAAVLQAFIPAAKMWFLVFYIFGVTQPSIELLSNRLSFLGVAKGPFSISGNKQSDCSVQCIVYHLRSEFCAVR